MPNHSIKLLTWIISAFGVLGTIGLVSYVTDGISWDSDPGFLLIMFWAVIHYGLLSLAAKIERSRFVSTIVLSATIISVVFAGLIYIDVFFIAPRDAQSAIILLFVPLLQNTASIILLGAVIARWIFVDIRESHEQDGLKIVP